MNDPMPTEDVVLSPAAQALMDQIMKLDPVDREKIRKKLLYQQAMREHEEMEIQMRKIEEQQRKRNT